MPRMVIPKIPINNATGGVAATANAAIGGGGAAQHRNNKINYGSNTTDNWHSPTSKGESETAQNKTVESCDDEDFF